MDRFEILGGVPLRGEVTVGGAKNAALPMLAATLLAEGPCRLVGVPDLRDIRTMLRILEQLGVEATRRDDGSIETRVVDTEPVQAPYELVKTMRASICVLGPLLGARGRAEVSFPGGCVIGPRPIDLHLAGLERLGATVEVEAGYIHVREGDAGEFREIYLGGPFGPTVTGTFNVLAAAVRTPGTTVIQSAACEPEVVDVARFLVAMGADIEGIGSPTLIVRGVERLSGTTYRVIPDRIEAGTLLCAGAMTYGDVTVRGCDPATLTAPLAILERMGVAVERVDAEALRVRGGSRPQPVDIVTLPYPGFPTDLQAQFMALLSVAEGNSFVTEKIYPERFINVAELQRMGARIRKEGPTAIVSGVDALSGCHVMASDLRASAALVVAGLAARGETIVERVYHIDRGYERIEEKLSALGGRIRRTNPERAAAEVAGASLT
ncbi:MAG: UDP-N-acetylglucosamine 1-carboxyvinyltransferase [Planctomycetota bacterium]|nr:UDP-N-acetylglucosamine 1-carboxyvinyltransferase [Planctomycetota bacterium]